VHAPIFAGSHAGAPAPLVIPIWLRSAEPGTIADVFAALQFVDVLGLLGIIVACGGLYYLSSRIEPHWVAKDGSRFLTVAQDIDQHGIPVGRRRDVRVHIDDESDVLLVTRRSILKPDSGTTFTVKSRSAKGKRNVYVLRPDQPTTDVGFLALRVPKSSNVVPRLDELLELTGDEATMRRERARYRADEGLPDPTAASDSPGSQPPDPPADRG
jgi:hypothetical protein